MGRVKGDEIVGPCPRERGLRGVVREDVSDVVQAEGLDEEAVGDGQLDSLRRSRRDRVRTLGPPVAWELEATAEVREEARSQTREMMRSKAQGASPPVSSLPSRLGRQWQRRCTAGIDAHPTTTIWHINGTIRTEFGTSAESETHRMIASDREDSQARLLRFSTHLIDL